MLAGPQRPSHPQWPHCPAPLLWAAECCSRQVASHFPGPTKASPAPHSVSYIPLVWSSPDTAPYPVVFPTFSSTWQLHNDGPGAHCCSFWLHTSMPCSGAPLHRKQGCSPFTSFSGTVLPTSALACLILSLQNHSTNCLPSWSVRAEQACLICFFLPISELPPEFVLFQPPLKSTDSPWA